MASIFTHAALPIIGLKFFKRNSWKLILLSVLTAVLPDIDVISLKFVSYASIWGHRGFTHGLFFGWLWAVLLAFLFFRKESSKNIALIILWFFTIHFSHSALDSMTNGGLGVGYFTPFSADRYFFSWRPLIVSPLEAKAFFSATGIKILLSELVVVLLPVLLVGLAFRTFVSGRKKKILVLSSIAIAEIAGLCILNSIHPQGSIFQIDSKKMALRNIGDGQIGGALGDLPENYYGQPIHTNINDYKKHGFLDRKVTVKNEKQGWGSPFFPNWYGGIAGRWQDNDASLMLRTIFGYDTLPRNEVISLLSHPKKNFDFLYGLSPAEKYDIAMGDYKFTATKDLMKLTHNRTDVAKDYYGICNGVAFASLALPEPHRRVKVTNPDGYEIEFHPNDIKALLSQAYYSVNGWRGIRGGCGVKFSCNINPALFLTAILNSIGMHNRPLVIDVHPGYRAQFYPLIGFKISVGDPLSKDEISEKFQLLPKQSELKISKVDIQVIMNSTIMSNQEISDLTYDTDSRSYQKVGVREVTREYSAYIGFDKNGEIRAGEWEKTEGFYPDILAYSLNNTAELIHKKQLVTNKYFRWDVIEGLYVRSLSGLDWNIGEFVTKEMKNYWVHGNTCIEYSAQWELERQYDLSRTTASSHRGVPAECFHRKK